MNPLACDEMTSRWDDTRIQNPEKFMVSDTQDRTWHQRGIGDCVRKGHLSAAQFNFWS